MEESGSEGLDDLINAEAGPGKFFDGVDCVCIVRSMLAYGLYKCLLLFSVRQLLAQHAYCKSFNVSYQEDHLKPFIPALPNLWSC